MIWMVPKAAAVGVIVCSTVRLVFSSLHYSFFMNEWWFQSSLFLEVVV